MAHLTPLYPDNEQLRAENVDRAIKQVTERSMVMKQVVMVVNSSSWQETYYRETVRRLGTNANLLPANVEGIPRLAQFPVDAPDWEKISAYQKKHGLESEVSWEDSLSANVDVIQRILRRIGTAIAFSVDRDIYDTLNATGINTLAIAAGETWDNATRASRIPHEHIARSMALILDNGTTNYKPDTMLVNPTDWAYLATNDFVMDSFDASSPNVMERGLSVIGTLLGLNVISDPVVPTDEAYVLQSKICGTYRVLQELQTAIKREEGIRHVIRAWEIGVPFVTDPLSITRITNTRS